jgi:hypothetical protein
LKRSWEYEDFTDAGESTNGSTNGKSDRANGNGERDSVEQDLQDLLDAVRSAPRAKRKPGLEKAIFPLSQLVTKRGLSVLIALESLNQLGRDVGTHDDDLQVLALRLVRAVGTPSQNGTRSNRQGIVVDLVNVMPERTDWLWREWIPAGEVTVLEGRKATGKSTVAGDIAARTSVGADMPDGTPSFRGNVLYLCGEESLSKTLRRRTAEQLQTLGFELLAGTFTVLDVVHTDDDDRQWEIPGDLDLIEEKVKEHDAKLLVIDVLDNFLGDKVDTHSDHSVRRALGPLAKLAQKLALTVIAIRHLRKGQEGLAIDQGMGSVGIAGQARSVLRADKHPDKDDVRVLALVACNLGPTPPSQGYVINSTVDDFGVIAKLTWVGTEDLTAEDLACASPGRSRELKTATAWLDDLMTQKGGRIRSSEAEGLVRDEPDFSMRTLKRAKKKMGIRSKEHYETSSDGKVIRVWYWEHPEQGWEPQDDENLGPSKRPKESAPKDPS